MRRFVPPLLCGLALLAGAVPAHAQPLPGYQNTLAYSRVKIGENHWKLIGGVELEQTDTKIFADEVELFLDENRAIATGNVVFTQGANRIAADRADFNTATRLGTFYNARGIATVKPPRQRVTPGGIAPPPVAGQDNDVYFFGETVEKIGPKKYKIINGGFSTCVQPTPRWDLTAGEVILNIDHYTILKEPTLMVKGVPLFYLPFPVYYPTKKEDRATGFLLPTYGFTSLRGQQLHNAFFWAINRSQDATIEHQFFSKVGQEVAGEYRYNYGPLEYGSLNAQLLDQHEVDYLQPDGIHQPGSRQPQLHAVRRSEPVAARTLPRAGQRQLLLEHRQQPVVQHEPDRREQQPADVRRQHRRHDRHVRVNATFNRSEYFLRHDELRRERLCAAHRRDAQRAAALRHAALLFRQRRVRGHRAGEPRRTAPSTDTGLTRLDFNPTIRFPFKKWQWFTVNSSLSWRDTYYTKSYDPATVAIDPATGLPATTPVTIDKGLTRQFFTATAQITGPTFNRIWDTPDNGYAEKFKHTIEPTFTVSRTSAIDNYAEIVKLEGIDYIAGGTTS